MNTNQPKLPQRSHRYKPSWTPAQLGGRALLASLILSVGLGGCSNRDSSVPTPVNQTAIEKRGDWFCQPAVAGAPEPWECVQDTNLAANPKPDRLPNAKEDNWGPTSGSPLDSDPRAPRPQIDGNDILLPENTPPPPPTVEDAQSEGETPIRSNDPPTSASTSARNPTPAAPTASTIRPSPSSRQAPEYIRLAYQPTAPVSILELPANFYAVQLTALSTAEKIEAFIDEHKLQHLTAAKVAIGDKVRYVLILGIYDSREKAEVAAADTLPTPLAEFTPWIRRLGNLQEAMRTANTQTSS